MFSFYLERDKNKFKDEKLIFMYLIFKSRTV